MRAHIVFIALERWETVWLGIPSTFQWVSWLSLSWRIFALDTKRKWICKPFANRHLVARKLRKVIHHLSIVNHSP